MPPTKRFREMEQLSGGEKTVAALALLFAVHSLRPSPFFVLDEVDAALDATNVARVAHYIRGRTRGKLSAGAAAGDADADADGARDADGGAKDAAAAGGAALAPFQSIVISLKDNFFEKADALVGVSRDADQGCSRTYTFDLERYEEPAEAA